MEQLNKLQIEIENQSNRFNELHSQFEKQLPFEILQNFEQKSKLFEKFNMEILIVTENLMETLMNLDCVEVIPEERIIRKGLVLECWKILEMLDQLKVELKEMENLEYHTLENLVEDLVEKFGPLDTLEESYGEETDVEETSIEETDIEESDTQESDIEESDIEESDIEESDAEEMEVDILVPTSDNEGEEYDLIYDELIHLLKKESIKIDFQPNTYSNRYMIFSKTTDIDTDSVELYLKKNVLCISGYRLPSEELIYEVIDHFHQQENILSQIYDLCKGKYGKFEEKFQLPTDADIDGITASNQKDTLIITVPKRQVYRTRNPYHRRMGNAYNSNPYRRHAFF